jgi:hypothetical protein
MLSLGGTASAARAGEAEQGAARAHCEAELVVPPGTCPCLAGKAAEMSEAQQALLAATVTGDEARAAELRATLPVEAIMQVGTFHLHQVPACAGG